ncbi:uncharacterized protein LOC113315873 [Papaver somniferum]|uniref:uncharacterized protein LOC113315873 n=1 Tax=Papaver somniferum TaxID=3469 RepID=UPI000E701452|nr:uncharacterized protein LOC113315873 [Papaver somniferum]
MVLGDLNVHLHNKGQSSNRNSLDNWVKNVIDSAGLMDLGFIGSNYTWSNRTEGKGYRRARIDFALHNALWKMQYPNSKLHHLPFRASDHFPILLYSEGHHPKPKRAWKFYKCWLRDSSCLNTIINSWNSQDSNLSFNEKINHIRKELSRWNREDFGEIGEHLKYHQSRLSHLYPYRM